MYIIKETNLTVEKQLSGFLSSDVWLIFWGYHTTASTPAAASINVRCNVRSTSNVKCLEMEWEESKGVIIILST